MKLDIQLFADGKVVIDTDLDETGFKKGLNKMKGIAKTGFKSMTVGVGAVATAMAGAVGYGVKYNAEIEQLETSFEVMTGSADKAKDVITKLKDIGAKTPFEVKGLAETTQLLMNYGFEADDAISKMEMLGDISQGSSEKMNRIATAYGQMSSAGKVHLEDIKQMIEAGYNPLQEISESTGESMDSLYDRISHGTISIDEITASMERSTSAGGKYFQSMEKQSQTVSGQISTLKDNVSSLAGTLTNGLSQSISGSVLPSLNDLISGLETAYSERGIGGFAEALGSGVSKVFTSLAESAPQFIEISIKIIENLIKGFQDNLPAIAQSAVIIIEQLIMAFVDMLPDVLEMGIILLIELAKGINEALPELIPAITNAILKIVDIVTENIDTIIELGIQIIIALTVGIIKAIPQLIKKLPQLITAIVRGLMNGIGQIFDVGKNIVKGIWNGISSSFNWIKNKIKGWVGNVVDFIKKLFGIHSPSTVMRDEVGKFLAQGLGVGFDKELNGVYDKMQNAIDVETSKMSANVKTNGTYQMAMAGTPTFNLLDNTNNYTRLEVDGKVLAEVVNTENKNREVAKA